MPRPRAKLATKEAQRVGARRMSEIPPDILAALNRGEIESRTLVEWLAIDAGQLICSVAPDISKNACDALRAERAVIKRSWLAAELLLEHYGAVAYERLAGHRSDTVRGWAALLVGRLPKLTFAQRLAKMKPLADDGNAGVRESAWMGLRSHIALDLPQAIRRLEPWTTHASPNLRRFASEATRPRGVWCAHIEALKDEPELGRPVLEPLKSDPAKYVQDSVGNWLNDAAKTQPAWVKKLTAGWRRESRTAETERICRRALRSLT